MGSEEKGRKWRRVWRGGDENPDGQGEIKVVGGGGGGVG